MSLIPYQPHEGREIVLRHHNAIVVRDPTSHRLEIRGLTECPTCHQPLTRSEPADRAYQRSYGANHESYVDPDYFRMLRASYPETTPPQPPTSPTRWFLAPAGSQGSEGSPRPPSVSSSPPVVRDEVESVPSSSGVQQAEGSRIRRQAFSPDYFNTFFVEERVLGRGGKGVVLLVRHEIDGCHLGHFACKRVPVGDDHAWLEKVLVEVELLAKLSHLNLVSYRHVWLESCRLTRFGPSVACAFILQQYCNGGDLHQYVIGGPPREATKEELKAQIRRRSKGQLEVPHELSPPGSRKLSFDEIYSLFRDITSGVAYLHAANYIHRDLKPSNCLLHRENGRLVSLISDFGEVQPENAIRKSSGSTGTISYCAPEVLKMDATGRYGNFTTKSDIFSLGMILYFMCFCKLPYRSANAVQEELEDIDELRSEITDWRGLEDERRERRDLPAKLYLLLKQLLALNPADRPSASEVLKAMRGETTNDGLGRETRVTNSALAMNGNRVQNLDSPVPSGTPAPELRSRQGKANAPASSEPIESWSSSTAKNTSIPANSESWLQEQQQQEQQQQQRPAEMEGEQNGALVISRSRSISREAVPPQSENELLDQTAAGAFASPLLLEHPALRQQTFGSNLRLTLLRTMAILGLEADVINYLTRLGIFFVKMTSLVRPCWPYMIDWHIGLPFVAMAALDLGLPRMMVSPNALQPASGVFQPRYQRAWGVGMSVVLLAVHFAALWVVTSWTTLCATKSHDQWHDW